MAYPDTLTGKALWLRAKDLGANGAVVTSWTDQSGYPGTVTALPSTGPGDQVVVAAGATPSGGKAARFTSPGIFGRWFTRTDFRGIVACTASVTDSAYSPANLIDTNPSNEWWAGSGVTAAWIRLEMVTPSAATSYTLTSSPTFVPAADPKDWTFQGSDDGSSWTTLHTVTGSTSWTGTLVPHPYTFANTTAYRYYRVNITAAGGTAGLHLAAVQVATATTTYPFVRAALTATEAWVVVKSGGQARGSLWSTGTFASFPQQYPYDGLVYEDFGQTGRTSFTPTMSLTAWRLYRVRNDGTTWQAWLDAVSQATASGLAVARRPDLLIGAGLRGVGSDHMFFTGDLAEVIFFDRVLTATEVGFLVGYFNAEHGLTVPGGTTPPSGGFTGWGVAL